jgi:hypothetical protein
MSNIEDEAFFRCATQCNDSCARKPAARLPVPGIQPIRGGLRNLRPSPESAEDRGQDRGSHEHHYPVREHLVRPGYQPRQTVEDKDQVMLRDLLKHRELIRAKAEVLVPDVRWDGKRQKVRFLEPENGSSQTAAAGK